MGRMTNEGGQASFLFTQRSASVNMLSGHGQSVVQAIAEENLVEARFLKLEAHRRCIEIESPHPHEVFPKLLSDDVRPHHEYSHQAGFGRFTGERAGTGRTACREVSMDRSGPSMLTGFAKMV